MSQYRPHTHYMGLAGSALRTAIGVTAGLCFVAFGYGQADIGGLMVTESFSNFFPSFAVSIHPHNYHAAVMSGVVVATWNIGCVLGAFLAIFMGDRLGRKGTIQLGLVLETVGVIIQASSFGLPQYVVGKVIAGTGNGFIAATIPAWQAECLKTHKRGTLLLVSFGTCITLGVTIAYWIVYALSWAQPSSASWRFPIAFRLLFALPALLIVCFMPDSPRWLLLQGKEKEALSVLSALNEMPDDHEDIRREVLQIKYAVKHMASAPGSAVFQNGQYRYLHRTLLAILLQVMQQFTGVNLFIQYLGSMFRNQLHFSFRTSLLLAATCSLEFFIASLGAVLVIDRFWGRRTLTMFGSSGMCLCMTMLTIFNYFGYQDYQWAFKAMTAFLFLYNTFFSIGWQGMSWMWAVELIPLSIRGPANAMATVANWISSVIVVLITPPLFVNTTWRTYILFAVCNAVMVPIIYFIYPETGSRSLEEVDALFKVATEKGNPWLSVVKAANQEPKWFDKNGDPTDSYGGSEKSEYDSAEKGTSDRAIDEEEPGFTWQNRPNSNDTWESRGAAPAPAIRRTHSDTWTGSRGTGRSHS